MNFVCPKKSIRGLKNVISGEISAEKNFFEHFYSTKRFVFEFNGESLELFLSYLARFSCYLHFRGFWQSTASS